MKIEKITNRYIPIPIELLKDKSLNDNRVAIWSAIYICKDLRDISHVSINKINALIGRKSSAIYNPKAKDEIMQIINYAVERNWLSIDRKIKGVDSHFDMKINDNKSNKLIEKYLILRLDEFLYLLDENHRRYKGKTIKFGKILLALMYLRTRFFTDHSKYGACVKSFSSHLYILRQEIGFTKLVYSDIFNLLKQEEIIVTYEQIRTKTDQGDFFTNETIIISAYPYNNLKLTSYEIENDYIISSLSSYDEFKQVRLRTYFDERFKNKKS